MFVVVVVVVDLGVWMVNVYVFGGEKMMIVCWECFEFFGVDCLLLIVVIVFISMFVEDLVGIGIIDFFEVQVLCLVIFIKNCGFDGVVCFVQEVFKFKVEQGVDFQLIILGICFLIVDKGDQQCIMMFIDVFKVGFDYFVIGCLIIQVVDFLVVLEVIYVEVIGFQLLVFGLQFCISL